MNRDLPFGLASRREILRGASLLAGGVLSGIVPRNLFAAPQNGAAPTDPVEISKQKMSAIPLQTLTLRDNLHLLDGPGGNMVALDGPDGKILVDCSFEKVAPKIKETMDTFSSAPLRMVIDTHWHFDHTDGNGAMHRMGATILAHENTRKRMGTPQVIEFLKMHFPASPPEALPQQTFTDRFELYFNREEIHLTYVPPAHTDSDIHVHFVNGNVLHMGDTYFNGQYPFIDGSTGGNINGMVAAAAKGIELADASTKIVPGHGPVGDKAALTKYRDAMATIRDRVQKQKSAGKSLEETVRTKPTAEFDAAFSGGLNSPDQFVEFVYLTL